MESLRPFLIAGFLTLLTCQIFDLSIETSKNSYSPERGPLMLVERVVEGKRIHAGLSQNGSTAFQSRQHSDFGSGDRLERAVGFLGAPDFESSGPPSSATWKLPVFSRWGRGNYSYLTLEYDRVWEITRISALNSAPKSNQE